MNDYDKAPLNDKEREELRADLQKNGPIVYIRKIRAILEDKRDRDLQFLLDLDAPTSLDPVLVEQNLGHFAQLLLQQLNLDKILKWCLYFEVLFPNYTIKRATLMSRFMDSLQVDFVADLDKTARQMLIDRLTTLELLLAATISRIPKAKTT